MHHLGRNATPIEALPESALPADFILPFSALLSMIVTMMDVRIVRVRMPHCRMGVRMAMRLSYRGTGVMFVLVMFVMDMAVVVFHGFV